MLATEKKINHTPEKNTPRRAGGGHLARECSDRTRATGFALKDSRFS